MELRNDKCNIKISADETYKIDAEDNRPYDMVINPLKISRNDFYKVLSITIDLFYTQFSIALVGDFFGNESDCAVLDDEILTVLQNDTITQIRIADGSVLLLKKLDCLGCNFGIYKTKQGYLIYGETDITMLDFELNKKWQFSGADIFVSVSGKTAFQICEQSIKLYDFHDNFYVIDFDGKLLRKG